MSLKNFVDAMPKVELDVHLEGSFDIKRLLLIAEQYDIPETLKHYNDWASLLNKPDYARLYDIVRVANSWVRDADDLSRIAYDLATQLSKQNVQYAEVSVCPALYPEVMLDLEGFFAAINDGRERAERAWGVKLAWVLNVPRDEPRRAEDAARWVNSIPAQRAGIIGFGLTGRDDVQPPGQFERPFRAAEKREIPRSVRVGEFTGVNGIKETVETLNPTRVIDGRNAWEDDELLSQLSNSDTALLLSPTRMVKQKWVANASEIPLRRLIDASVPLVVGSDMPTLYKTNLNQEYLIAVEQCGLSTHDLIEVALTAVRHSALSPENKEQMVESFRERYDALQAEHLVSLS